MKKQLLRREDYLKQIYLLSKSGIVRGAELADCLEIKRPTVCVYLKRLIEFGDILMDKSHHIYLTSQGTATAEAVLEKHDLLFHLLKDLGVSDGVAAKDACAIEHNISPETYMALKQLLNERQGNL